MVSLTFDDYEPQIINKADVDGTNDPEEKGELIFELRYSVAAPSILIKLVVDILRDTPADNEDSIAGNEDFNEGGHDVDGVNIGTDAAGDSVVGNSTEAEYDADGNLVWSGDEDGDHPHDADAVRRL